MKKYIFAVVLVVILLVSIPLCVRACDTNFAFNEGVFPDFLSVVYVANTGGTIEGKASQLIKYSEDTQEVTAIANAGYYFVQWSDGVTSPTRCDKQITKEMWYYAEFAPITNGIKVVYDVAGDGELIGSPNQLVQYGTDAWKVEVHERVVGGPRFLGWSDGYSERVRHDKNVTVPINVIAKFGYSVDYKVEGNGSIIGLSHQLVASCDDAQTVTAIPDEGYTFVGWSDGEKKATRTDKYILDDKQITAIFEWRDTDYFQYHYNYATDNRGEYNLTINREVSDRVKSIIPSREFFDFEGWFLDKDYTQKAFDENGNNLLGEEIFNSPSRELYAKWAVKEEYVVTYKVLMVYVTAVDAKLKGTDGNICEVNYRMTNAEMQACYKITEKISNTLNQLLDGLVHFEVDSYFTTETIDESCIDNEAYKDGTIIYADAIPELSKSGILENYRSVITTFSFDDEKELYPSFAGISKSKYASIPADKHNVYEKMANEDSTVDYYGGSISTYIHEFIHTLELSITCFWFHSASFSYLPSSVEHKLFMLNQFPITFVDTNSKGLDDVGIYNLWASNTEMVGIPYYAWANEIFNVQIETECVNGLPYNDCGYIAEWDSSVEYFLNHSSNNLQRVPRNSRTTILVPRAAHGYKFIGWSDGYEGDSRIITNVTENLKVIAYFERISFTAEYLTTEGGKLVGGPTVQTVLYGERYKEVIAVADEGYRFVGWSDGVTSPNRTDWSGGRYYDIESGEWSDRFDFTVTAIFEKI